MDRENLTSEESIKSIEAENHYNYIIHKLEGLMTVINNFIICPPYEENYTKKIKENFIKLKEIFKDIRYILSLIKSNNNEKQYSLNIMDEIELNIINKLLNDDLKLDAVFIELILIKEKLYHSLRNFNILVQRGFYNPYGIFSKTQFKEYNNFLPNVEKLLRYHDKIFDEIFVIPFYKEL